LKKLKKQHGRPWHLVYHPEAKGPGSARVAALGGNKARHCPASQPSAYWPERPHWDFAAELLLKAAETSAEDDIEAATAQMERALRVDGWL